MNSLNRPKLRNVTVQRTHYQGEPVFLIQDGLKLTEAVVVLPQVLGPLAMLCDGEHTLSEIEASLEARYGLQLPQTMIENLLEQFDEALLLEGETFNRVRQQAVEEFRSAPYRRPTLAGPSYPADPDELRSLLQDYIDDIGEVEPAPAHSRGIVSPHIDYGRGGGIYAQVWTRAAEAVRAAELIIIIGTDHNGGPGTLTLTHQNYASPLGIMPTDTDLVDRLVDVLGPERAFAEELHHRGEHSIELDLVWLQYLRDEKSCPVVPILVGSFRHFMLGEADIAAMPHFEEFVSVLRQEVAKRRTVIVASGDLAHLGPVFDTDPMDPAAYAQMKVDDDRLIESLVEGNADKFFDFMQAGQYERNVCGLSPFYFTMKTLGQPQGHPAGYDRCLADGGNTSYVSICGLVWE